MTDTQELENALCPTPHKRRYATEVAAREVAASTQIGTGNRLVPYDDCSCGWIHLTKERETGPAYTEAQLLAMDQAQFNAVVRMDVTGRGNPDTFKSLRAGTPTLSRWDDALKTFCADIEAQLIARTGDRSPNAMAWRARIARVRVIAVEKQAAIRHIRRRGGAQASALENARSAEGQSISFSKSELRHIAGERALDRLKKAHQMEFLTLLQEEHSVLGIAPSNNLLKALHKEGVMDTEPEEKS